jgi:transposase
VLECIGEEESQQIDYIPARVQVLGHIRLKYACPCCKSHIKLAEKPAQILPKSNAAPSLLAHIACAKYVDGTAPQSSGKAIPSAWSQPAAGDHSQLDD